MLELGAGWYSTPLLHEIAADQGRMLITVESNCDWLNAFRPFAEDFHKLIAVETYDDYIPTGSYGLVLIDHGPPERRIVDIKRLLPHAELFVIHDTEAQEYKYDEVWPLLDRLVTQCLQVPWTTLARPKK